MITTWGCRAAESDFVIKLLEQIFKSSLSVTDEVHQHITLVLNLLGDAFAGGSSIGSVTR